MSRIRIGLAWSWALITRQSSLTVMFVGPLPGSKDCLMLRRRWVELSSLGLDVSSWSVCALNLYMNLSAAVHEFLPKMIWLLDATSVTYLCPRQLSFPWQGTAVIAWHKGAKKGLRTTSGGKCATEINIRWFKAPLGWFTRKLNQFFSAAFASLLERVHTRPFLLDWTVRYIRIVEQPATGAASSQDVQWARTLLNIVNNYPELA